MVIVDCRNCLKWQPKRNICEKKESLFSETLYEEMDIDPYSRQVYPPSLTCEFIPIENNPIEIIDPFTNKPIKVFKNKPPLVRMGGKRYLAKYLVSEINALDYSLYIEPFFGGGRIYFEKIPHFAEIINDLETRVSNFFFCARHWAKELTKKQNGLVKDETQFITLWEHHDKHYKEIVIEIKRLREEWYENRDQKRRSEIREILLNYAIEYYFLSNMAFRGSKAKTMTYFENDPRTETNRMRWRIKRPLEWMGMRMGRTQVMNRDFAEIFKIALHYDNHTRIWYLDPPYWEVEGYENEFPWEQYEVLNSLLLFLPNTDYFIFSINIHKDILELFRWCNMRIEPTRYTTGGAGQNKNVWELILTPPWEPKLKEIKLPQQKLDSFLKSPGEKKNGKPIRKNKSKN